jgi:hypothetical protein
MIQQRLVVAIACEVRDKPILLGARWKALEKPSALKKQPAHEAKPRRRKTGA